jgi:hypothetical protein
MLATARCATAATATAAHVLLHAHTALLLLLLALQRVPSKADALGPAVHTISCTEA